MEQEAPERTPRIVPMLAYEDASAALTWLAEAFGFRERTRIVEDDGTVSHAEMELGDGLIMLATPTPNYQSPKHHREVCEAARRWSRVPWVIDGLLVHVKDLDAHYTQAQTAGARILSGPEEQPSGRRYRAEDLEGHRWMFVEPSASKG